MLKKLLFVAVFAAGLLAVTESSYSQTMYFCADVDRDGYPITESDAFTIRNEGDYVNCLVRLPYEISCYSVRLEIYRNGAYDNTVYVDTEKNWVWFYKQIKFYKTGRYTFYCYDCFDYMLTSGSVKIDWR